MSVAPHGASAMFDSIIWACEQQLSKVAGRRILVITMDGPDNASRTPIDKAIEAAIRTNTALYVIAIDSTRGGNAYRRARRQHREANELASRTGGLYVTANGSKGADQAFHQIAANLNASYAIIFQPGRPARKNEFRAVKVVTTRDGLRVATSAGYYGPPN